MTLSLSEFGGGDRIQFDYGEGIETLFNVDPPVQKVEKGFGYKGVVLRDTVNDVLQCHICGKWFARLYMHTYQAHKINDEDYKIKFGLPLSFPLNSVAFSKKQSKFFLERWADSEWRKKHIERVKKLAGDICRVRSWKNHIYGKTSSAWINKNGMCKEQVHRRYIILCDNLGRQASNYDLRNEEPGLHVAIRKHWGTFNKFKLENGYPLIAAAKEWNQDKIIASLRKYFRIHASIPIAANFRGQRINGFPSHETVRKHFGSWNRAMTAAGFKD